MNRAFGKRWLVAVFVAIALAIALAQVQTAQATEYWKGKFTRFYATAGESLSIGDVVCLSGSDSRAYKADADNTSLRVAVGVVGTAATAGASVEIVVTGIITGQTAASVGSTVYLSTVAGAFTTTHNSWNQALGVVIGETTTEVSASTTYFISALPQSASQ